MRWLMVFVVLLVSLGCGSDAEENGSPMTTSTFAPPHAEEWEVSDVRVWTRDDLAYWVVSYDARWLGEGPPGSEKCVFQVKNQEGIVVRQTGEVLEEGDDVEAETIYPDEVPGQPKTVSVDCEV